MHTLNSMGDPGQDAPAAEDDRKDAGAAGARAPGRAGATDTTPSSSNAQQQQRLTLPSLRTMMTVQQGGSSGISSTITCAENNVAVPSSSSSSSLPIPPLTASSCSSLALLFGEPNSAADRPQRQFETDLQELASRRPSSSNSNNHSIIQQAAGSTDSRRPSSSVVIPMSHAFRAGEAVTGSGHHDTEMIGPESANALSRWGSTEERSGAVAVAVAAASITTKAGAGAGAGAGAAIGATTHGSNSGSSNNTVHSAGHTHAASSSSRARTASAMSSHYASESSHAASADVLPCTCEHREVHPHTSQFQLPRPTSSSYRHTSSAYPSYTDLRRPASAHADSETASVLSGKSRKSRNGHGSPSSRTRMSPDGFAGGRAQKYARFESSAAGEAASHRSGGYTGSMDVYTPSGQMYDVHIYGSPQAMHGDYLGARSGGPTTSTSPGNYHHVPQEPVSATSPAPPASRPLLASRTASFGGVGGSNIGSPITALLASQDMTPGERDHHEAALRLASMAAASKGAEEDAGTFAAAAAALYRYPNLRAPPPPRGQQPGRADKGTSTSEDMLNPSFSLPLPRSVQQQYMQNPQHMKPPLFPAIATNAGLIPSSSLGPQPQPPTQGAAPHFALPRSSLFNPLRPRHLSPSLVSEVSGSVPERATISDTSSTSSMISPNPTPESAAYSATPLADPSLLQVIPAGEAATLAFKGKSRISSAPVSQYGGSTKIKDSFGAAASFTGSVNTSVTAASNAGGSTGNSGNGKYECEICHRRFARPSALTVHSHMHTGAKPFSCLICERSFSVNSNLRRHLRTHTRADREAAGVA